MFDNNENDSNYHEEATGMATPSLTASATNITQWLETASCATNAGCDVESREIVLLEKERAH